MTRASSSSASNWYHLPAARGVGLALWVVALALPASAQQVYKITGPDGKVMFSDRPPPAAAAATAGNTGNTTAAATPSLPYELQQLASKYPVTLYTSANCGPCDSGKKLLVQRGIPHTEKTVTTNEDLAAFARLSNDSGLPLLTIAGQQIKGYSETEWSGYLDAAGYPKQSALPSSYRPGPASPLSPLKIAPVATGNVSDATGREVPTTPTRKRSAPTPALPQNTSDNPAGIKF